MQVLIIGSNVLATTFAKIIANNVRNNEKFSKTIKIYIDEDITLTEHDYKHPLNIITVNDLKKVAETADILFIATNQELLKQTCELLSTTNLKPTAFAASFLKGFYINETGKVDLLTNMIKNSLKIDCCIIANPAIENEIIMEGFCEATVGSGNSVHGLILKEILQTSYLKVTICENVEVVEACSALNDIVAFVSGLSEGSGVSENTTAAIIRLGLMEIIKFCEIFYPKHDEKIFLQSFSLTNLISSCNGGLNHAFAIDFVTNNIYKDILPTCVETARLINVLLKSRNLENRFPLFTAVYKICVFKLPVADFIDQLKDHPEYI